MVDWAYGERYNSRGEWNPRLILCEDCQDYKEPEEYEECLKNKS